MGLPLSSNEVSSQQAVGERWQKLYRRIHNLYIFQELVHIKDFLREIKHIHKRIDDLNIKVDSNVETLTQAHNNHMHIVNTAGSPTAQTGTASPTPAKSFADKSPIAFTPFEDTEMQAEDRFWFNQGLAKVPFADSTGVDGTKASAGIATLLAEEG